MARARNIKPGFYKNEDLAECSPWARLIFPGLWMLADREGRMEDRPKRIKGELLPYDAVDVEPLLEDLAKWGFILRYQVAGERFIQVLKFSEHQTPHIREVASTIPAPVMPSTCIVQAPGETDASTNLGSASPSPRSPDVLIPESPLLNPDTGVEAASMPAKPAKKADATATRLPADWLPSYADARFCEAERPDLKIDDVAARFLDYWIAQPGAKGRKTDWSATWRNWVRNEKAIPQARASPGYQTANDKAKAWADRLTGKNRNDQHANPDIVDINPAPYKLG